MSRIIYYVASSLDGFIAGPNDDVSKFVFLGAGVEKYQADLAAFKTVIMGRKTYEFGYQFGPQPGQPAYPHMEHFIFSDSLKFDNAADSVHVVERSVEQVNDLKEKASTDIYLCGGGQFAGWLLDHGLVDQLKLKLNPIVLGGGVPLFGEAKTQVQLILNGSEVFEDGLQILDYNVKK